MLVLTGKIPDPLPHVSIWLACRRAQGEGNERPLPDAGGVLDQNHELMWAFGVLDQAYHEELELKKQLEQQTKNYAAIRAQLLQQQ